MRRALLTLTLTASLAVGSPGLLDQLWSLVSSIWSAASPGAGCGMDPSGWCAPAPQADEGCGMDPDGRCKPGS
jgi:hypothetical protein